MKTITRFLSDDGCEFDTETKCRAHEGLSNEVGAVLFSLPALPKDDGCKFANGHGYIQHDPEAFKAAKTALLRIGQRVCPHKFIDNSLEDPTVHPSWVGRIFSDNSRPLYAAWGRVMCTDDQFREWGQPYYANNPKGEFVRINP